MPATPSLAPGEQDLYKINSVIRWLLQGLGGPAAFGREVLSADRIYYVRTDGSDSNGGTVDSAGGAFLTIQKAVNAALTLDGRTFNITIQVRNGTFAEDVVISAPPLTTGAFSIVGDTTTPGNVVVNSFSFTNQAFGNLGGFRVVGSVGIRASTFGNINITGAVRLAATSVQIFSSVFSNVSIFANITFDNVSSGFGFLATFFGSIQYPAGSTATYSTPTFTTTDMHASTYAQILFQSAISGTATGKRFFSDVFSTINSAGRGVAFFPGTIDGSTSNGGVYI